MADMKSLEPTGCQNDWHYFREHQDRCYRVRLAAPAEIGHLQKHHALDNARIAPGCFIYAVSRLKRAQALELQTLFVVLPPQPELDEADCMSAWDAAADTLVGAHVERLKQ